MREGGFLGKQRRQPEQFEFICREEVIDGRNSKYTQPRYAYTPIDLYYNSLKFYRGTSLCSCSRHRVIVN
jgi:hypothetical protein